LQESLSLIRFERRYVFFFSRSNYRNSFIVFLYQVCRLTRYVWTEKCVADIFMILNKQKSATNQNKQLSTDNSFLWEFFKKYIRRKEEFFQRNQAFTLQINKQNTNLYQTNFQLQQTQVDLNAAICRYQKLETLYLKFQKFYAELENQLQKEKQNYKNTRDALETKIKKLAKTKKNLERYWSTFKNLSKFLTIIQVISSENKTIVITTLLSEDNNIESLLINIENKKKYIQILKNEYRRYKHSVKQKNYSHFNNTLKISNWSAVELDDRKRADIDRFNQSNQKIIEIKQKLFFKKKARFDRKSARKNNYWVFLTFYATCLHLLTIL